MKRYILSLLLASFTLWLMAVPAMRIRRSVVLDDGRTVMVTAYGDEDFDYLLTDEGEVVLERDNVFHCTGLTLTDYLATLPQGPRKARQQVGSVASALVKPWGVKKIPVILAAFKDKKFSVAATDAKVQSHYDNFFNGVDIYGSTGNWGSVRQYFIDQSLEQFQPEFTVIGPVQLDENYSYYGGDKGGSKDTLYSKFVRESFTKARNMLEDWTPFDNDGDGRTAMATRVPSGLRRCLPATRSTVSQ